jgi:hypothetical protein
MDGVLNLLSLARSAPGQAVAVPGTGLEVLALEGPQARTLEQPLWLATLEGELIVDLPHGDFRILKAGDSLRLEPPLSITLNPLESAVVVQQRSK